MFCVPKRSYVFLGFIRQCLLQVKLWNHCFRNFVMANCELIGTKMVLVVRMTSYKLNKTIQRLHYPSCQLQICEEMWELSCFCYQRQPFARKFSEYAWEVAMFIKIIFSRGKLSPPSKCTKQVVHVLSLLSRTINKCLRCLFVLKKITVVFTTTFSSAVSGLEWFFPRNVWMMHKMVDACQEPLRFDILPP